ncbi:MAG: ATP-binding protein, partial [Micromonosporaceae bacterium]|nr:ATP-binding protein [Micromonosporaceae bacterium]
MDATAAVAAHADPSLGRLLGRVSELRARVRAAVDRRRAVDPGTDDPFRGLYVADAEVDALLDDTRRRPALNPDPGADPGGASDPAHAADTADAIDAAGRLGRLARAFGLTGFDVEILLVALAPDLDPSFERLYAYLQDDVSRRRASTGLALELCGGPGALGSARLRLMSPAPLVIGGLVLVEETERPFLTRSLRVPDRVLAWLLGHDEPGPDVAALSATPSGAPVGD